MEDVGRSWVQTLVGIAEMVGTVADDEALVHPYAEGIVGKVSSVVGPSEPEPSVGWSLGWTEEWQASGWLCCCNSCWGMAVGAGTDG